MPRRTAVAAVFLLTLATGGGCRVTPQAAYFDDKTPRYFQFREFADGHADKARFGYIYSLTVGPDGAVYAADIGAGRIRRISPTGEVTTRVNALSANYQALSGANVSGTAAVTPEECAPLAMCFDRASRLFVLDNAHYGTRVLAPQGGASFVEGSRWEQRPGMPKADWNPQRLFVATGLAIAPTGEIYYNDNNTGAIKKLDRSGQVTTVAGGGPDGRSHGYQDGPGKQALFSNPSAIARDAVGNLYVADTQNWCIRRIAPDGHVSTLAGGARGFADGRGRSAQFGLCGLGGIAVDAQNRVLVADGRVRRITPDGEVTTLAGDASPTRIDWAFYHGIQPTTMYRSVAAGLDGAVYAADATRVFRVHGPGHVTLLAGQVPTWTFTQPPMPRR
jgi:hypothetical protein